MKNLDRDDGWISRCDVLDRLNNLGLHKLPHEFPQEKGNLILQITNLGLICLKNGVKVIKGLEDEVYEEKV